MMSFFTDEHPGKPKILFVGLGESTHTHAWIDLLKDTEFNVRLFALPSGVPPDDWRVPTYVTSYFHAGLKSGTRTSLHSSNRALRFARRNAARARGLEFGEMADRWLAEIVRDWRPDIIHTLGADPAGEYFFRLRERFKLQGMGKWVLQTRGGSDMALMQFDSELGPKLAEAVRVCDQVLYDNLENYHILRKMGLSEEQFAGIAPVPGTGGLDVEKIAARWDGLPSQRRKIVWPKVYETVWSKALPVFEAIKLSWDRIQPCEIEMLAMNYEARLCYETLPDHIREYCHSRERISRESVLDLMTKARVMLAPSLVDGIPNSLYEAMAAGAFPIVSPLDSIRHLASDEQNVLFARNLYPDEIAEALTRAMNDDALVDATAKRNLELVGRVANRGEVRRRVINFYQELADQTQTLVAARG
jgi:glycosyltransferase involved in cell wall biosynthesis